MNYINKENRKKSITIIVEIVILIVLILICGELDRQVSMNGAEQQSGIARKILRFHVIANSDSEVDQNLKIKVKEATLEVVRPMLADAQTIKEAEAIIADNMDKIEAVAQEVILTEGYTYQCKGVLGKTTFPIKQYGELIFPAGEYEAFRLLLGEAKGKNWWCVMFPTLCFVDETYDVITEENKEEFRDILTKEEYESLISYRDELERSCEEDMKKGQQMTEEPRVFYKLKSLIWINKVIDYLAK